MELAEIVDVLMDDEPVESPPLSEEEQRLAEVLARNLAK